MQTLPLTPDELLTTTRAVRKRLDFSRPVEPEILRECLEIAIQAPTGSNRQHWQFVLVSDPTKKQALSDLYRTSFYAYRSGPAPQYSSEERAQTQKRIINSSDYLAEHMQEAPYFLIPCIKGRYENQPAAVQASSWGSVIQASWSFMLAARARGLGTVWTTLHLVYEREAANILGIPYEKYTQAALIPIAYSKGTNFKPAQRDPLDTILHWNQW
jgi:nitroreductase